MVSIRELRQAAGRASQTQFSKSLHEARAFRSQTAFLSHSHDDADYALGLQVLLKEQGWDIYLDWQDHAMPSRPNRETASRIQERIRELDWFLFLATPNSMSSRWCPWEIGYADGEKDLSRILVVPTQDYRNTTSGNEYIELYRSLEVTTTGVLAAFDPGQTQGGRLVRSL